MRSTDEERKHQRRVNTIIIATNFIGMTNIAYFYRSAAVTSAKAIGKNVRKFFAYFSFGASQFRELLIFL